MSLEEERKTEERRRRGTRTGEERQGVFTKKKKGNERYGRGKEIEKERK